jgi:hypothetical protein
MPRLPINYANTIIYKIVCNDLNITECYVGHTTDFVCRKKSHKKRCTTETDKKYNLKVYKIIRDNGGWDNYSIIEIEKFPCQDVNEAKKKEREWFENLNSSLNTNFPQRNKEEYRIANKDKLAIKKKEYYIANRDEFAIKQKEYHIANRDEIVIKQKERRILHKDEIAIKKKEYYIANIDEIKEKKSKKFVCECGKERNYSQKARHMRTKVHIDYLNTLI